MTVDTSSRDGKRPLFRLQGIRTTRRIKRPRRGQQRGINLVPLRSRIRSANNHLVGMAWMLAFIVPALLTLLALLLTTDPVRWVAMVHLVDRVTSTSASGLLFAALLVSHAATATPVIVSSNARPLVKKVRISVAMPTGAVTERLSGRMWSIGLFAAIAWLATSTMHLTLHQVLEPADSCNDQELLSSIFCALGTQREQQLLALQVALLAILAACTVLEVAGSGRSDPRILTVGLAFTALIPGAIAEMDPPISVGGVLIAAHVVGSAFWVGGLLGLARLIRLCAKQSDDVHVSFIYVVAARYSETALAASLIVLISGVALALSGPGASLFSFTPSGWIAIGKTGGALLLLGAGLLHRLMSLPRLLVRTTTNPTRMLCLLGIVELVIMAACYAGGVALSEHIFRP